MTNSAEFEGDDDQSREIASLMQKFDVPETVGLRSFASLIDEVIKGQPGLTHVSGARGSAAALFAHHLVRRDQRAVFVASDADAARALVRDIRFLADPSALLLLPPESSPWADVLSDQRAAQARLATLVQLTGKWKTLVIPASALVRRTVDADVLRKASVTVQKGQEIDRDWLVETLDEIGYTRSPVCEDVGAFAVRGALIDIWSPMSDGPVRLELDGDEIVGLKQFDPEDQRTVRQIDSLWIIAARECPRGTAKTQAAADIARTMCDEANFPSTKARALVEDIRHGRLAYGADAWLPAFQPLKPVFDLWGDGVTMLIEDPAQVVSQLQETLTKADSDESARAGEPHFGLEAFYVTAQEVLRQTSQLRAIALHRTVVHATEVGDSAFDSWQVSLRNDTPEVSTDDHDDLQHAVTLARTSQGKNGALGPLLARLQALAHLGYRTAITGRSSTQTERIEALLKHRGIRTRHASPEEVRQAISDTRPGKQQPEVLITTGGLSRGLIAPTEGFALITEEEIFGTRAERRSRKEPRKSKAPVLQDLRSLAVGDYIVHVEHGIGRYLGLQHRTVGSTTVDLLCVEYASGDKLYLPVYRLNQIQRYAGSEASPKLDRLGGQSFSRTKSKVKKQLRKLADELLRLYAERRAQKGEPLAAADDEYREFEATFPFEETPDQGQAIADVDADLESPLPMDRLVCGDVGFGKTEVAIRAAFRVANAQRQVAILCPTTVLAQQHLLSFRNRFAAYPFEVRVLSRFQTKAEQDATVRGLKGGSVDVVIGTHRMLSKDVHFKNLGLLVVDEEQRFGVTHKERIKHLKKNVDVLTLSATPIPRTLQMAVSGIRDMSIINSAPVDRRAIRTVVTRPDDGVVKEAIQRELSRGGQVFFVYNRVEGLHERARRLQELIPEARVCIGHGQMPEAQLERAMLDFVNGEYDVLCATAIIESGLDIPRANTMIIDRADLMGLSQLYQLRGRVGRSRERAYCYLMVPPQDVMSDDARARIEALERHTELGSGIHVAALDLELRGGGELLGADQSGTAGAVGFELYCQMLDQAVRELTGEEIVHEVDPELSFDVDALLPDDYIEDTGVRLTLYKRFASASSVDEVQDLATEMEDRFGPPPSDARRLVHLMRLKAEMRRIRVLGCEASARSVTLHLRSDAPIDPQKIMMLVNENRDCYRLTPDMRLTRRSRDNERFASGLEATDRLLSELPLQAN